MKNHFGPFIFLLLLSGCIFLNPNFNPATTAPSEQSPSLSTTGFISTPSQVPVPIITKSSPPDPDKQLLELVQTNGQCDLPCWWGVNLGVNSWTDVETSFAYLGGGLGIEPNRPTTTYSFNFSNSAQTNSLIVGEMTEVSGVLSSITVHISGFSAIDIKTFQGVWRYYAPENLFRIQGSPSRIWVSAFSSTPEKSDFAQYQIWFFYDSLNFIFRYTGFVQLESTYEMCPFFGEDGNLTKSMDLYISSDLNNLSVEEMIEVSFLVPEAVKSIDEISSYSASSFYEAFLLDENLPCILTARTLWP
jgi:hypothetical protein